MAEVAGLTEGGIEIMAESLLSGGGRARRYLLSDIQTAANDKTQTSCGHRRRREFVSIGSEQRIAQSIRMSHRQENTSRRLHVVYKCGLQIAERDWL
jgi:hypothetical protein